MNQAPMSEHTRAAVHSAMSATALLAFAVLMLVLSQLGPNPEPTVWNTRPATEQESRQRQIDQQTAELLRDMGIDPTVVTR